MRAITKILAGGVAIAALASAAPAAAQYYPGYGYRLWINGGNVVGQVLEPGARQRLWQQRLWRLRCATARSRSTSARPRCSSAWAVATAAMATTAITATARGGRVLGISRVEPRSNGGLTVRGVATSGRYAGYGYGGQGQVDLTWKCKVDYRGYVSDIDLNRAQRTTVDYGQTTRRTTVRLFAVRLPPLLSGVS